MSNWSSLPTTSRSKSISPSRTKSITPGPFASPTRRAPRCIDWTLASSPEFRQMMSKYSQIKSISSRPSSSSTRPRAPHEPTTEEEEEHRIRGSARPPQKSKAEAESKARRASRILREPVEKQNARELFAYIVEQGKKDYQVQRYKGLGEMTSPQLWETTMDPERRTLLQVKLEDIAETDDHLHHPHGRRRRQAPEIHRRQCARRQESRHLIWQSRRQHLARFLRMRPSESERAVSKCFSAVDRLQFSILVILPVVKAPSVD